MNKPNVGVRVLKTSLSVLLCVIFLIPILYMLFDSIKTEGSPINNVLSYFAPPYTLHNYYHVIVEGGMLTWIINSLIVAIFTTILVLLIDSLASYAISRIPFRYKTPVYLFFLAGMMVPGEATIIPLYVICNQMHLLNSYNSLILPALASPLAIIIFKSFFDSIPKDLVESAQLDGCGLLRIYWSIILPLSKSVFAAMAIFTFIGSWNNFLWPLLAISATNKYTIPIGIPQFNSQYTKDYVIPMAANAVASLPMIIAFLFFEKQIVKGIALTGIKG